MDISKGGRSGVRCGGEGTQSLSGFFIKEQPIDKILFSIIYLSPLNISGIFFQRKSVYFGKPCT